MTHDRFNAHERLAIDLYCGGDESFFAGYRDACRRQFKLDMAAADRALTEGDIKMFTRTVHSMKSVLKSLGMPQAAQAAVDIETEVGRSGLSVVRPAWAALCADIASAYGVSLDQL